MQVVPVDFASSKSVPPFAAIGVTFILDRPSFGATERLGGFLAALTCYGLANVIH